jgi:hypothetical protein
MQRWALLPLVIFGFGCYDFDTLSARNRAPRSLRFHGNGAGVDRVRIRIDGPPTAVDVGATDFTIEFWLRANAGDNTSAGPCVATAGVENGNFLLDRSAYNGGLHGLYMVVLFPTGIAVSVSHPPSDGAACGTIAVADGGWHHVAITRQLSSGQVRLFVDGRLDFDMGLPPGDLSYQDGLPPQLPTDPYLVLGAQKNDSGAPFRGWMDELRFSDVIRYDSAFVPARQPFQPDRNTVGLFHFDEGSGTKVYDSSAAATGTSDGDVLWGGMPAGPEWTTDRPF